MKRVGLIVNPIAGLGGRVGLKGSDGQVLQALALARGAEPRAAQRARLAIETLLAECDDVAMIAAPGAMGADALNGLPISVQVLPLDIHQPSTAEDTMRIARAMCDIPVDLLLFAGGDGTARDIYHAVGSSPPVLGIPAGVKIQSGVFAVTPLAAGEIAACFLSSSKPLTSDAEVADLDEETYISGEMNSRLFGVLRVPYLPNRRQNRKAPTPEAEAVRAQGIAADVAEKIQRGWLTILGPGMTAF